MLDNRFPRFRCLAVWVIVGALALLPACADKQPVRLGFLGGLTGRVADLGIAGRDGALLAVEEANARGGIRGRPVRLLVRDDGQDTNRARAATRELLALGVTAIVGPMTSAVAMAVLPVVEQSRAVLVSPTVSTDDLTGRDDRLLRVAVTAGACARKTARHLVEQEGLQTAVAICDLGNASYTRSWMDQFHAEFTRLGGAVLRSVTYVSSDTVALHEIAQAALEAAPQVLVVSASAMDAAMLCQQLAKRGAAPRVAVSEWAATESFLELGGAAVEGVLVNQFFDRTSTAPAYLRFRTAYRTRFAAEPGFASVTAYDAANLALTALTEKQDGEDLKQTLLRLRQFQGVQGRLTLDAYGDSDREPHLSVVRNGAFQPVE